MIKYIEQEERVNLIKETKNAISYKNHIDMDGDYNPDYIMLINQAFNGD